MVVAIKLIVNSLFFIIGGLALYKGYEFGWALLFAFVVGAVESLGLTVLFPWLNPGKVRNTCTAIFFYDVVYVIAVSVDSFRNELATMNALNIDAIIWWLSPWLGLLTIVALARSTQVKKGRLWEFRAGFGTFICSLVFVLLLGLTFNDLLRPSAVGNLYAWIGSRDEAIVALTTAIKAHPKDSDSYYTRGVLYLQTDKPNKSLADFTSAIDLASDNADAHLMRAVALVMIGDENKAKADIERCLELEPDWKTKIDLLIAQAKRP